MTVAFITHRSGLLHEMGPGHPECPQRLAAIHDRLVQTGLKDQLDCWDAPAVTKQQALLAHTEAYWNELFAKAPSQGYAMLDGDTAMNQHSLVALQHAAGAAVLAVDLVCSAKVTRAFCAVRPPGHHALADRAMGFCMLNNVAIATRYAVDSYGLQRVLVVDFDVHHGNGTESILADDPNVLMVSTFQSSLYPGSGERPLGQNMLNVALPAYSNGQAMRDAVQNIWWPAVQAFAPQLIVVSAGFDAHRADELAQLGWVDEDYAWISHELVKMANLFCDGRLISSLEGGYDLGALARSVSLHVQALLSPAA
jgi:acetoin utilization deacetylase AcuC-like enzyme